MIKIAHAADIHIRSNSYLDEMEYTFQRFYESLREEDVDLIFIGGDVYHSKLTVSNEYFELAFDFFKTLGNIAPTVVIPGNHDLSLNNKSRQDAIFPVIKALDGVTKYKITYSKRTESWFPVLKNGEVSDIMFHHFSILDKKDKWQKIDHDSPEPWHEKINVGLYHGSINGCKVDNGWTSRGNRDGIDIFKNYDFGFLGDIHLYQSMDAEGRILYPGSIRQNNYGETVDKGYLLWKIEDKDNFEVERRVLDQKRYFFTLYAKSVEDIRDVGDLHPDCRIRVKLTEEVSEVEKLKIKSEVESLYSPRNDVQVQSPDGDIEVGTIKVGDVDVLHENIREPEIQKELINEFFKDKGVSEEEMKLIHELDKVYHSHIETDVERNKTYKLGNVKFSNLFSYGEKNNINFPKLKGLIGLFGENASGKSSIMDIISFGLHNKVSKEGVNKSIDYINRRRNTATCEIPISMNSKSYFIDRSLIKKETKNGDKCFTEIDFYQIVDKKKKSENGEKKPDTNKKIYSKFGTDEDLWFTSLCTQFGLTNFIDARGTKKKESLSKYFDLEIFKTKFDIAKKDYDKLKVRLEEFDYSTLQKDIESRKIQIESLNNELSSIEDREIQIEADCEKEELRIRSLLSGFVSSDFSEADLEIKETNLSLLEKDISNKVESVERLESLIDRKLLTDSSELEIELESLKFENSKIKSEISEAKTLRDNYKSNSELIKEIPNVPQCQVCKLASYAYDSKQKYGTYVERVDVLSTSLISESKIKKIEKQIEDIKENNSRIETLERYSSDLENLRNTEELLKAQIEDIKLNLQKIKESDKIKEEVEERSGLAKEMREEIRALTSRRIELVSQKAINEDKIKDGEKRIEKCENLTKKKFTFELYLEAMGKNGISYWIISKKMPILNRQVNLILSQTVNFRLYIEDSEEDKSVKIFIVDQKGKRPVELGSGMEKTMAGIALRAALWNICLLPKTPILILDEAFSHLDSEKYDGVINLLNYLKKFFDAIIIITHKEDLKTVMDHSYYIKQDSKGMSQCQIG